MITGEYKGASLGTLTLAVGLVVGLGVGDDEQPTPASPTADAVFPDGTIDGPAMRHLPPFDMASDAAEIRGTLVLEGECLLLMSLQGARFPIAWPASTMWDAEGQVVVLHSGERVVIGSDIEGAGGYADTKQVVRWLGDEVAALADRCVDGDIDEVAYLENTPDAVQLVMMTHGS
ncbi:MAG TPA: hypothetical protein DDY35_04760 [Acidimicrobiaceae bacterium]|nr:hypothetical protein [Acidimicrobiaceae bacterium]HBH75757.1 hypothetical protein [Acidimicrobiaceae bacterium]|tara:strand:- start:1829 stop:2353 length:525 start_codon:yes stop_codon:yes gene_type:complete